MTKSGRGDRPPTTTIKDIASALGVSHATVSRALNDSPLIGRQTKERVRAAAKEMGYIADAAAKVMRGGLSNIVGFILPDVQNHFYSTIAKIIAEAVSARGMQLVLAIAEDDPEVELRHVRELRQARARGIVITPAARLLAQTAGLLEQVQTVQLVRRHPAVEADLVGADDEKATGLSTRKLLELGHEHIGYIGGGAETLSTGLDRLRGFEAAIAAAPAAKGTALLGPPRGEFGYRAASKLLRMKKRPSGIVLGSSQFTLGTLGAIREAKLRIPEDISLVAYDDPDWFKYWEAGISTIELPMVQIAKAAAEYLCGQAAPSSPEASIRLLPGSKSRNITFPPRLIIRGTTCPPTDKPR